MIVVLIVLLGLQVDMVYGQNGDTETATEGL